MSRDKLPRPPSLLVAADPGRAVSDERVGIGGLDVVLGRQLGGAQHALRHHPVALAVRAVHEVGQLVDVDELPDVLLAHHVQPLLLVLGEPRLRQLQHPAEQERQLVDEDGLGRAREVVKCVDDVAEQVDVDVRDARAVRVEDDRDPVVVARTSVQPLAQVREVLLQQTVPRGRQNGLEDN